MKAKNYQGLAAITLLALMCWCGACSFYSKIDSLCSSVSVKWKTGGVSPAELVRQEEYARQDGAGNQPEVTLWQETSSQTVTDNGERSTTSDIIAVFGNCENLTNQALLYGSFPARTDTSGCAVSSALAFSLWGSVNVLDMPIELAGEVFYVRGVFDSDESKAFSQCGASSDILLSNMQLTFASGGSREEAENFLARTNFSGGIILDLPLLRWSLGAVLSMPMVLLAVWILLRLLKRGLELRHYPILLAGFLPLCLLAVAGLHLCRSNLEIPAKLIPTMWSDFSFWQNRFLGYMDHLMTWLSYAPTGRDMELWGVVPAMLLLTLAASVTLWISAKMVKVRSYKGLVVSGTAYMLALGLVSYLVSLFGTVVFNKTMYLLPCLWLGMDYMLHWHDTKLKGNAHERKDPDDKNNYRMAAQAELPTLEEAHITSASTKKEIDGTGR